jgi:hypothetical protein
MAPEREPEENPADVPVDDSDLEPVVGGIAPSVVDGENLISPTNPLNIV